MRWNELHGSRNVHERNVRMFGDMVRPILPIPRYMVERYCFPSATMPNVVEEKHIIIEGGKGGKEGKGSHRAVSDNNL